MTIRLKLTLLFVALLATIGLIWGATLIGGLTLTLDRMAETDVRNKVHQVGDYLRDLGAERRRQARKLDLTSFDALPRAFSDDGMYLQLTDLEGRTLNKSPNLGAGGLPIPERSGYSRTALHLPHLPALIPVLVATRPLMIPGRGEVGWIQAAYPIRNDQLIVQRFTLLMAVSWLLLISVAFIAGYFFAGRALRPVSAMTEAVRRVRSTDLHQRLSHSQPPRDEIDMLGVTFNELFDRLELAFQKERRFIADASHELKSPLTSIIGNLQLIRRRGPSHPAEVPAWAQAAEREALRLTRLVEGLLDLARAGEGKLELALAPVDLGDLAREVAEQFAVLAPRVTWRETGSSAIVEGDRDRLKQVLINLVDNAVRATRERGEVYLETARSDEQIMISVVDTGIGIPAEALPKLFHRFYRVDAARDRTHGGIGLGLPITAAIVQEHGGRIDVQSVEGQGTRIEVSFPTSSAA